MVMWDGIDRRQSVDPVGRRFGKTETVDLLMRPKRSRRTMALLVVFLSVVVALLLGTPDKAPDGLVCGPDRCQTGQQACSVVRAHAAEVRLQVARADDADAIPVEFGYLADEFVEAACGL